MLTDLQKQWMRWQYLFRHVSIKWLLGFYALVFCLFMFLLVSILGHYQITEYKNDATHIQSQLLQQAQKIDNTLKSAQDNVVYLHQLMQDFFSNYYPLAEKQTELLSTIESLSALKSLMKTGLSQHTSQFGQFFALATDPAKTYFNEKSMLYLVSKQTNTQKYTQAELNAPENMREQYWKDGNYIKNTREKWYHNNYKKHRDQKNGINFIPTRFDKDYTETNVFSLTLGVHKQHQMLAVVGVHLSANHLFSRIEGEKIGQQGGIFLVNRESGVLLSQVNNKAIDGINSLGAGFLILRPRTQYNLYKSNQKTLWEQILRPNHTQKSHVLQGIDRQPYVVFSHALKNAPWVLVAYHPQNKMGLAIANQNYLLLGILLFILGFSLLLVLQIYIQDPLKSIYNHLKAVSRLQSQSNTHKLNQRLMEAETYKIPPTGILEVYQLSLVFNSVSSAQILNIQTAHMQQLEYQQQLTDCHKQLTLQTDSLAERAVQLTVLNRETQQYRQKVHLAQENLQIAQKQYQKIRQHAKKLHLKADKAENEASQAGLAKAQFLANMNHELRTPMNAIIGYTEILQEDVEDLGTFEFLPDLQKIHGASYHLLELINNLFNLSRLENAQLELYLEHFDVSPVLQDVASSLQPLLDQQENNLKLELDGALGSMYGDINKVRQNLLNLLSNASKFSKHGHITLSAYRKISGTDSANDKLIFRIVDEGIGMSETQINHLFDAFSKFDSPSAHKHGGAGLGLVLTKHFCDLMGGSIEIESTLGEGTSIIMCLPANYIKT